MNSVNHWDLFLLTALGVILIVLNKILKTDPVIKNNYPPPPPLPTTPEFKIKKITPPSSPVELAIQIAETDKKYKNPEAWLNDSGNSDTKPN